MNEYPELSTLYNNGMGSVASMMAGQRSAHADEAATLANQASQIKNTNDAAMSPLNQQYRQGEIARQGAELPGIVGQSQTQAAAGLTAQQNQALASKAKAAEYFSKMDDEQLKQVGVAGQKMTAMAAVLERVPPGSRQAKLHELMGSMGVPEGNPLFSQFGQVPEDRLAEIVAKAGTTLVQSSGEFIQKKALQTQKEGAEQTKTETQGQTSRDVARINAEARITAAEKRASAAEKALSDEKRWGQLNAIPEEQRTEEQQAEFERLTEMRLNMKTIGGNATGSEIIGGKPVTTPTGRASDTAGRISGKNKQPSQDIEQMVKQSGGKYEPNKYNYRINPQTGKVQYAPK